MSTNNLSDEAILPEIYFLIAHFLNNSPFKDSAKHLIEQLHQSQVLPKRLDWNGNEHSRTFEEILQSSSHVPQNFLLQICNQLRNLFDSQLKINFSQVNSLLGSGQFSALQDIKHIDKKFAKSSNLEALPTDLYSKLHSNNKTNFNYTTKKPNGGTNLLLNLQRNELIGTLKTANIIRPELFRNINIHKRILGHLSAVYCVCFDRSGRYILTGADDNLIKIWSAADSRLLTTLRGHEKEISDIDINFENTLLASGSCDKSIRIWNLKTSESTTVLQGHGAMVTSLEFSPYCQDTKRWLASSGNDGAICFWSWNSKTLIFNPKPKKFIEKSRPGTQMLCISFSSGGSFLATGSSDFVIRVYFFDDNDPIKVCELESHTNIVDSIQYANNSAKFLSGSKDGTARIWKYESLKWKAKLIDASITLIKPENNNSPSLLDISQKSTITMVTWNCDDNLVATAQNNFLIKVWNANTVQLIHELKGHSDEIFVLEAHPNDPRLLLSAGYDGFVIIWNILSGKMLRKFYNRIENEGHGCLFDTKWSPTTDMIAGTDSHGYLTIFGFGNDNDYARIPNEQFFHTDYRPLMRDSNEFVVDEQTQQPPHLMAPPFLVNADGNPYDIEFQRLVPGRQNLTDTQLNPQVITNERGLPEIVNMEIEENNQNNDSNLNAPTIRNNLYIKNLISPMDLVIIQTSEEKRGAMFRVEENYFITEYRKELKLREDAKSIKHDFDFLDDQNSNQTKRRRGKKIKEINDNVRIETTTTRNRLFTAALFDTDHEDESEKERRAIHIGEETMEDINIDEDSNTQYSHGGFISTSNGPTTSSRANRNDLPSTSSNFIEPIGESENSDSSEYSDWADEEGRKTKSPRKTQRVKVPKPSRTNERPKRRLRIQEDDEDEEIEEEPIVKPKKSSLSKKLKKIISDDEDETEVSKVEPIDEENSQVDSSEEYSSDEGEYQHDMSQPCTSQAAHGRNFKSPSKRKKRSQQKASKHSTLSKSRSLSKKISETKSKKVLINTKVPLTECPNEYRPPEWLTSTKPKKSPYVPQMGDSVVYFRQGHELYVDEVKKSGVYKIDEDSLPWKSYDIKVQEFCKIIEISIVIRPPRLVNLKLGVVNKYNDPTGVEFDIEYHDMPHVVDFVILRQFYNKAIEKNWRPKDRFRSIIDDNWYLGIIEENTPYEEQYPQSNFQCLKILWDNGDREALSPWDLEPLSVACGSRKRSAEANTDGAAVTSEELKALLYVPEENEWPPEGRDYECERIFNGLQKIMELSIAEYFNFPVDLDSYPLYALNIAYPMDLSTIRERLDSHYYRRSNSLKLDIEKIQINANSFNESDSEIVMKATMLCELLIKFIEDTDCTNPMPIYKQLDRNRNNQTMNKSLNSTRRTRNTSNYDENTDENEDDDENNKFVNFNRSTRNRRSKNPNNESTRLLYETRNSRRKTEADAWIENCKKLIADIYVHSDAGVFIHPVDLEEFPDYTEIIETPISFSEIKKRIEDNIYENLKDFDSDCKLIFQNSKAYNTNKRSKIYVMTQRLNSLYDSRISEIKSNHQMAIQHEAIMLSKYRKNKKIKHERSRSERNSKSKVVLNNAELYSDQLSSPGISTRSTNKKSKTSIQAIAHGNQQPTTSKSANYLNNCFVEAEIDLNDTEYDINISLNDFAKIEQSSSNNSSINPPETKRSKKDATYSDSEPKSSNSKSNIPSFYVEPNQNANMGFINSDGNGTSIKATKLSFSNLKLPKKLEDNNRNSISSDSDDNSDPENKKSTRRKPNRSYVENSDEEIPIIKSKKLQKHNDIFEDEEDNYEGLDTEDDKDADYEITSKNTRSKNNENQKSKRNRPLRKSASKNLDDKENEDDYEITNIQDICLSKSNSSSKAKKNQKATKSVRTSGRNRKNQASNKNISSSSAALSSNDSESEFETEASRDRNSSRKRKKKRKQRLSSSYSSTVEISPPSKSKKCAKNYDDNASSDFDPYSNDNSHNNSNVACSSKLSSRGRLLKTVSQY